MSDRNLWERQPSETAKAFAAFCIYHDIPPLDRSVRAAVAQHRQNGGKASVRNWETWSSLYNWSERSLAGDSDLASRRREQTAKELERSQDDALILIRATLGKVAERIQGMDIEDLAVGQIPAALRTLWGHRLSAMETARRDNPPCHLWVPSMGPPPFGDGNFRYRWQQGLRRVTFNGATAFRRWKLSISLAARIASRDLQWGHRLSAMETRPTGATRRLRLPTFNGATAFRRWKRPSYWPPPCRLPTFNGATAFRRWKRARGLGRSTRGLILQWGHRLSAMETFDIAGSKDCVAGPSMGPPPFGDGNKRTRLRPPATSVSTFNGATAFRRWKPLFVARLRHGFIQKRVFPQEPVTG